MEEKKYSEQELKNIVAQEIKRDLDGRIRRVTKNLFALVIGSLVLIIIFFVIFALII